MTIGLLSLDIISIDTVKRKKVSPCKRILRIYSFKNKYTYICVCVSHTVGLTIVTMLCITSLVPLHLITESMYPLTTFPQFSLP